MGEKKKERYGEGNYDASERYREGAEEFAESEERVDEAARSARDALEGEEREELERAEREGKSHARTRRG